MADRWSATPASDVEFRLAEGPVWDADRGVVHFVEIKTGTVHTGRLAGPGIELTGSRQVDRTVGAVALGRTGELLVAGTETLLTLTADGEVRPGPRILPADCGRRLNDGKCDPDGAFLVGSMRLDESGGDDEVLVRVTGDGAVTTVATGLGLSNGLAWSPSGDRWYHADTTAEVIHVWSGGERREFVRDRWYPDGICTDADGNLWVAVYGTGQVRRFSPGGELTGVVEVGSEAVTCPAFVGPDLDRLMITTRHRLYLADVGAAGLPPHRWGGFR